MTTMSDGQEPVTGDGPALKILLVDDVQENLELMEDVLAEIGYTAFLARNGVEALSVVKNESVHMIVADAMMPKMDGFQLCKEVRAIAAYAKVPFIIYTGNYVDTADEEFARSIGVDRYVVKHAGLGALVQAINELARQCYGRKLEEPPSNQDQLDDQEFLEKHRAIVIKKLEEKMAELEIYAETLVRKNREVQASEERYRSLFDHASVAIFVLDRSTENILDVNQAGMDLLGYSRDEVLMMPRLPFTDTDFAAFLQDATRFTSGEMSLLRKDGEVLQVDVGFGPLTRTQDMRILVYIRDITEQRQMRQQLMQAEKMTLMGRLAAGIAHEIRNPLSAIALNLQYLITKADRYPELREPLEDALEGTKRIETVIENTLNLARFTPPVLHQEQINELVRQVLGFVKISVQQKDIQFDTALIPDLPPARVDAKQIHQVLLNVLQNAIDASMEGGHVHVSTGIEPWVSADGLDTEAIVVKVRDYGRGISPEQRRHLFEQFYTTKKGGTGLGLSISRQIMDKHQGEIRFDSPADGGTLVRILFPIHS
jgi:PAS domain S-box-containing protein